MPRLVLYLNVVQSDVQKPSEGQVGYLALTLRNAIDVLVDRLEGAGNREIVLELNGDSLVGERFEYREDQLAAFSTSFSIA